MDYIICNKNTYIKLNLNGTPVSCGKNMAQRFEYSKAMNILSSLPKELRKFHFKVQAVPEISSKKTEVKVTCQKNKIIETPRYELPESVTRWIEKVECLNGLAVDAAKRLTELQEEERNINQKQQDVLHEIELSQKVNACEGYKMFRDIRNIRKQRRDIKDELTIVNNILESNIGQMAADRIKICVEGLKNRTYTYRNQGE